MAALLFGQLLAGGRNGLAPSRLRQSSPAVLAGALLILTGGTLSTFWATSTFASLAVVIRMGWILLLWFWALRAVTTGMTMFDRILLMVRWGAMANCFVAIGAKVGINPDAVSNTQAQFAGRQSAFFDHPNGLAGFLVMVLPLFLLDLPFKQKNMFRRIATSGLVLYVMTTTGSMTSILSTIVAVGVIVVTLAMERSPNRLRINPGKAIMVIAGAFLGLAVLVQSNVSVVQRFNGRNESGVSSSVNFREQGFKAMLNHLDEHLLIGTGFEQKDAGEALGLTAWTEASSAGIHSMLLRMIFEAGLLAAIGVLVIVVHTLRQAYGLATRDPDLHARRVATALLASTAGLNFLAQFQPMAFERFFWLPIGLIGVLWSIRRDALRNPGPPPLGRRPVVVPGVVGTTG